MVMLSVQNDDTKKYYGLRVDDTGHAYVYVPWEGGGGGTT